MERNDRLRIGQDRRVQLFHTFERLGQVVQFHEPESSTRM